MRVLNIENIKSIKAIDSNLRKGIKLRGEIKEINLEKGEATLVLKDGKELKAKIEVDISKLIRGRAYSFEVLSSEGGEIKLKVEGFNKPVQKINNNLELFMKENNLSFKLKNILEVMLKHEIPLTKENINKFNNFLSLVERPVEEFEKSLGTLEDYIKSKVSEELHEKIDFKNELRGFFKELSKINKGNMASLLENNIVIDKENIRSFNNIFKSENSIFHIVKDIESRGINEEILSTNFSYKDEEINHSNVVKSNNKGISSEYISEEKEMLKYLSNKNDLGEKSQFNYSENNYKEEKINNEFIKNEIGESYKDRVKENYINKEMNQDEFIEGILSYDEGENKNSKVDLNKLFLKDKFPNILKSIGYNKEDILQGTVSKEIIEEKLSKFLNKKVHISVKDFEDIKEKIKDLKNIAKENKTLFTNTKDIVSEIKNKEEEMKGIIKNLIKETITSTNKSEAIANLIKNNINDFKLFNDFSNEYYYLDVPININKEEYGFRLIIKDERLEGKELNKNNIKLALAVKTVNIGEVDALLKFSDKNLNIEIKVQKENIEYIRENLSKLEKSLELLGFMPYIFVSEKVYEKSDISTYRDFFNNSKNSILDRLI